jgi:hypothetical protein
MSIESESNESEKYNPFDSISDTSNTNNTNNTNTNNAVNEAVNEYYKLKAKYETENQQNKKKILNNKNLSWREKKREFQQLRPKCINCKRPGGTIFSIRYNENSESRELKAICGVKSNPCNLDIFISMGKYQLLPDVLSFLSEEMRNDKNKVINYKNYNVFGYISSESVLDKFQPLKESISENVDLFEFYLNEYLNIVENKDDKQSIERNTILFYQYVNQIKESIKQFNISNNEQFINDVVDIYKNKLVPLLMTIINLKYKEKYVWYDQNAGTYHLIQKKYSVQNIEILTGEEKIIKYIMSP